VETASVRVHEKDGYRYPLMKEAVVRKQGHIRLIANGLRQ
jgi:hypothetical protein